MNRTILILCWLVIGGIAHAATHSYASHSKLSQGNIVKMQIGSTGVYKVTYEEIVNAGLDPQKTGVLGYGGALLSQNFTLEKTDDLPCVAVYRHTGSDGKFNTGDYLLFYAQGPISWSYSGVYFTHTRNHCSDYGYYFLSDAEGSLREMETSKEESANNAYPLTDYTYYEVYEKDLINLIDPDKGAEGGGREFYGERINPGNRLSISFTLPDVNVDEKMVCAINVAAQSSTTTSFTATMGGQSKTISMAAIDNQDFYTMATTNQARMTNITPGETLSIHLQYTAENSSAKGYLNYLELTARCHLYLRENTLLFRDNSHFKEEKSSQFMLEGADEGTEIWDVSRLDSIHRMPTFTDNGKLCFYGSNQEMHEYVAVRTSKKDYPSPVFLGTVKHQDLHALKDIDLLIISPEAFCSEAERLGEAHWQKDGITYAVVSDEEVYNEFSSGTPDVSAIRWVMKMLYDRWKDGQSSAPKYLLLMGDGTFDNRQILPNSGKNTLITYQAYNSTVETKAYATDDYFGFLEDNDGMMGSYYSDIYGTMRVGVGRLPVNTLEEATAVVDKIIAYMENSRYGKWKQQLCFLADDGDHGQHTQISDLAAEQVRISSPDFVVNKIYLDAYPQVTTASSESYPLAFNRFTNLLRNGVLIMDYTGHGSANNICSEMFLTKKSVEAMENTNQGFWMLATCSYAHFDQKETSSAELAILNPRGAAIGVMSACRTVYASENSILNKNVCTTLMTHNDPYHYPITLGEAIQTAKNLCGKNENKLPYIFLGDPAIRLNYPTGMEVIGNERKDTLHALELVHIKGYIRDENGDTVTDFQGHLDISIYDKLQQVSTRDNDETDPSRKTIVTYNDYPNLLYSGSTEVTDGQYEFEFRMPKDIRYNFGNGRIVYCAYDTTHQWEAIGHDHDIVIGGSDSAAILLKDTTGPSLHIYMDNPLFQDGGKTSEYPHFFADIEDENGINTVGNGIGHDLTMVIDNDTKQTYTLNEYYTSGNGSYQYGQVSYALPKQAEGQHFLLFRAWDQLNNSATAQLSYQVVEGLSPRLYEVCIYPNPCVYGQNVTIYLSADRTDEALSTTLAVYALSGQKVTTMHEDENRSFHLSTGTNHMTAGIYIIRMEVRTNTSGTSTTIGKLIVL